jgi:hypothetical protein
MESFESLPQDFLQAVFGAVAASIVAAGSGFLITRIPRVRQWFQAGGPVANLVATLLVSIVVAGVMGLFLRHLSWREVHPLKQALDGFSIITGGQVDPTANQSCKGQITDDFRVEKEKEGLYKICLKNPVVQDSMILTSLAPSDDDKPSDQVSARVINTFHDSFVVQTLVNGSATNRGFWFLVIRTDGSS